MPFKIAIIGAAGFIGSSLTKHLRKRYKIRVLDLKPPSFSLDKNVDYQCCDIRDIKKLKSALKDVSLVIHTAIIQIPLINQKKKFSYQVNVLGTQNICKIVDETPSIKGMLLTGTWHVIGEKELRGLIDEEFGFRPDKVEDRARLYALSKMAQEAIVRFYDEMSDKVFGIIRMGTVLGQGMPEKTAASIFMKQAFNGGPITPYKHSMYRPMLYVDTNDICKAFENYVSKILKTARKKKGGNSLSHIVNVYCPKPITILELAQTIKDSVIYHTKGKIKPKITVVDEGKPLLFTKNDKNHIKVNINKAKQFLGLKSPKSPKKSIEKQVLLNLTAENE